MWLERKVHPPSANEHALPRPTLVETLEHSQGEFATALVAPAGFGKSTLTRQWLDPYMQQTLWVTLSEGETEKSLLTLLSQAIRHFQKRPVIPTAKSVDIEGVIRQLQGVSDLQYLVISNVHLLANRPAPSLISHLIELIPRHIHIVLIAQPNWTPPSEKLILTNQLRIFDAQQLTFSQDECFAYLSMQYGIQLSADEANTFYQFTRGWPGFCDILASHYASDIKHIISLLFSDAPLHIPPAWRYIEQEIFQRFTLDLQQLLLDLSCLETFSQSLISQLSTDTGDVTFIDSQLQARIMLLPSNDPVGQYEFHPVFRAFLLYYRLRHQLKDEVSRHKRIAACALAIEDHDIAISQAISSDDAEWLASLLNQYGQKLFNQGKSQLLHQALQMVPQAILLKYSNLIVLNAWDKQSQNEIDEAQTWLSLVKTTHPKLSHSQQGEICALEAQVALSLDDPSAAFEFAEQALSYLDHASYRAMTLTISVLGEVQHVLGNLPRALSLMQQAEKYARQYTLTHQILWALVQQGEIYLALAKPHNANELVQQAKDYAQSHNLLSHSLYQYVVRLEVQILFDMGHITDVFTVLNQNENIRISSQYLSLLYERICWLIRGDLPADQIINGYIIDKPTSSHEDLLAQKELNSVLKWRALNEKEQLAQWFANKSSPKRDCNHYTQMRGRVYVLALSFLGQYKDAVSLLERLYAITQAHGLENDRVRLAVLRSVICLDAEGATPTFYDLLLDAVKASLHYDLTGELFLYHHVLAPHLKKVLKHKQLSSMMNRKGERLLTRLEQLNITKIIDYPIITSSVVTTSFVQSSPLTEREWVVLQHILAGDKNETIAFKLDIAPTTVKSHIRNLYQKLNVSSRKEAKKVASELFTPTEHGESSP